MLPTRQRDGPCDGLCDGLLSEGRHTNQMNRISSARAQTTVNLSRDRLTVLCAHLDDMLVHLPTAPQRAFPCERLKTLSIDALLLGVCCDAQDVLTLVKSDLLHLLALVLSLGSFMAVVGHVILGEQFASFSTLTDTALGALSFGFLGDVALFEEVVARGRQYDWGAEELFFAMYCLMANLGLLLANNFVLAILGDAYSNQVRVETQRV
jgi:hypothetical protein